MALSHTHHGMAYPKDEFGWVRSMDGTKKADIIVPLYSPEPYDILAIGIAAVAVFFVVERAYRAGINEYIAAEDRALSEIGVLK